VEWPLTAGTISSLRYLMISGISFSMRSVASLMVLLTRADASSTLRSKSFMVLLAVVGRKPSRSVVADAGQGLLFRALRAGSMAERKVSQIRNHRVHRGSQGNADSAVKIATLSDEGANEPKRLPVDWRSQK